MVVQFRTGFVKNGEVRYDGAAKHYALSMTCLIDTLALFGGCLALIESTWLGEYLTLSRLARTSRMLKIFRIARLARVIGTYVTGGELHLHHRRLGVLQGRRRLPFHPRRQQQARPGPRT